MGRRAPTESFAGKIIAMRGTIRIPSPGIPVFENPTRSAADIPIIIIAGSIVCPLLQPLQLFISFRKEVVYFLNDII